MKKNYISHLLAVSLLTSSTFLLAAEDKREIIYLDQASRAFVKQEMQENLQGIQKALAALAKDDVFEIADAFRPMGMQGMSKAPTELRHSMPMGFKKLGMPLHMAFEKLTAKVEAGASTKEILADLSKAMEKCVACHAAYRIEDKK